MPKILLLTRDQVAVFSAACAAAMEQAKVVELRFTVDDAGQLGAPAEHLDLVGEMLKTCDWHGEVQDFIATRKDVNPKEGKDKYGDVPFADAKNKKYPIDTAEHIRAAWNYINKGTNSAKYKPADVASIKAKIVAAWKSKIDKAGPPAAQKNNADLGHTIEKVGMQWCVYDKDSNKLGDFPTHEQAMSKVMELGGDPQAASRRTSMGASEDDDDAEEMALMAEHANTIKGVEIFGAGTHNGDEYTEKDLDDMVAAFGKLDVRPALKVGHTKDKVGAPAYGWISNLRRAGSKLIADFENMHDSVVQAIRDRRYDRVSSEIYFNLKRGGETFRRALKAVALLGVDVPAVAGLKPLHKVEFSGDACESLSECDQDLEIEANALVETLAARVDSLITLVKENGMNKEQIKKLKTQLATFEEQLKELKGKKGDETKVAELEAKAAEITAQIKALEQAEGDAEENAKLKTRVATLEAEGRSRELKERLASITVPSFRPILRGFIEYALEHPEVKVKTYAVKDGKEVATEVQIPALVDSMVAEVNAQGAKLFKAYSDTGIRERMEGHEMDEPGKEVDRRAKELQAKDKKMSYEDAMIKVLADDQDLAKRYETERGGAQ